MERPASRARAAESFFFCEKKGGPRRLWKTPRGRSSAPAAAQAALPSAASPFYQARQGQSARGAEQCSHPPPSFPAVARRAPRACAADVRLWADKRGDGRIRCPPPGRFGRAAAGEPHRPRRFMGWRREPAPPLRSAPGGMAQPTGGEGAMAERPPPPPPPRGGGRIHLSS